MEPSLLNALFNCPFEKYEWIILRKTIKHPKYSSADNCEVTQTPARATEQRKIPSVFKQKLASLKDAIPLFYCAVCKKSLVPWKWKRNYRRPDNVIFKSSVFWDITPYNLLKFNRSVGGSCLHFQGWIRCGGFLLGLFFDPEVKGDMFPRNIRWHSADYIALYHTRQTPS
jgi:hypothetical protein